LIRKYLGNCNPPDDFFPEKKEKKKTFWFFNKNTFCSLLVIFGFWVNATRDFGACPKTPAGKKHPRIGRDKP